MSIDGSRILQKLNLQTLASRLGVQGIITAVLDPVVRPVAIVDGSVQASTLQTLDVPFTAGETTAPAANTRLMTGPPLALGQWNVTLLLSAGENCTWRVRRRNAADSADVWEQRIDSRGSGFTPIALRALVAAGEFFVVENVNVGGAGNVYDVNGWFQGPF